MTKEELVETVHKEIMEYFIEPLNGHRGLARAIVNMVLEEAAKMADSYLILADADTDFSDGIEYGVKAVAAAIRTLKSEPPK